MSAFYILSKIFNFFLNPFHWILILAIILLIVKKRKLKKRLGIISLSIFIFFTNQALLNLFLNNWQPQPKPIPTQKYSAGILLGGMTVVDKNNQGFLWQPADRLIKTVELYYQGAIKKIVVTGGSYQQKNIAEADFLKQELLKCGIPATDIFTEIKSTNTFENAIFSKRILDSAGLHPPFVLITSAMHMPRAVMVFNKSGLQVVSFPCNYEVVKQRLTIDDFILPKPRLMDIWARFIKEIVGIGVYKITGKA